jgi:hypothetical protein
VPAASAALALDHHEQTREPESQAPHAPSASSPTPAPKKRGRPRSTPIKLLSPLGRWVVEERNNNVKAVADELGIDQDYLYLLMKSNPKLPSPSLAIKIYRLSGGKLDPNKLYLNTLDK